MATRTVIIQYIAVRQDLLSSFGWPIGAVIAQACHASSAVLHTFHDDPHVQEYLHDINGMHKVVLQVSSLCKNRVSPCLYRGCYVDICLPVRKMVKGYSSLSRAVKV